MLFLFFETVFFHYDNQLLNIGISAKEDETLSLDSAWPFGTQHVFEKDSLGNVIKVKVNQFNEKRSTTFYYYKETNEIRKACDLLKFSDKKELVEIFQTLVHKYPNHWFLKDAHEYIRYVNGKSANELIKQYEKIVGKYSNRNFWGENNKLFYKRDNLAKVEILPISDKRDISLSKYTMNYEFNFLKDGNLASFAWTYDVENEEWKRMDDKTNYLLKDYLNRYFSLLKI